MVWDYYNSISFSEPRSPWPAVGKRELWKQPFRNNKGNNRILPIRFHAVCIYGACLKWLLPELSIPTAGQKDRGLWGRECSWMHSFSHSKKRFQSFGTKFKVISLSDIIGLENFLLSLANHNPELRCVICSGVTFFFFAQMLHLDCSALSQSQSSYFSCIL